MQAIYVYRDLDESYTKPAHFKINGDSAPFAAQINHINQLLDQARLPWWILYIIALCVFILILIGVAIADAVKDAFVKFIFVKIYIGVCIVGLILCVAMQCRYVIVYPRAYNKIQEYIKTISTNNLTFELLINNDVNTSEINTSNDANKSNKCCSVHAHILNNGYLRITFESTIV